MNKELFDFKIINNKKELLDVSFEFQSINLLCSKNIKKTSYLLQYLAGLKKHSNIEIVSNKKINIFYVNKDMMTVLFLSVLENIKLVSSDESTIVDIINSTELKGYENYIPTNSNSGLKHRIALAKALLLKSDLIIFDDCIKYIEYQDQISFINLLSKFKNSSTFLITTDIPLLLNEIDNIIFLMKKNEKKYYSYNTESNILEIIKNYNNS